MYKNKKCRFLTLFCLMTFLCFLPLYACKSSVQVAVEKQESEKEQKQKESGKAYQESVKAHQAKQSKTTRKMMKKSEKKRKKTVGRTIRKNRGSGNCTN